MKQLGILFLAGVVLISAGCMKNRKALKPPRNPGDGGTSSAYNPMNPTLYRGEECPNGVTIEIQPPAPPLNANADLAFTVVASGCKYGYDMVVETIGQTISLAPSLMQPQLDPTAVPYRASFVRNFSRSGSNTVSVNLMPKNRSNAYTAFFVSHLSINLTAELTGAFTCTVEPSHFSVPANSNSFQNVFTVHSTAASTSALWLTSVTRVEGYSSVSQVFSNLSVPTSSGVEVTVPGQSSGTLKFKVETNDGQSAECLSSWAPQPIEAVTGNFVGRAANETIRDRFYLTDIVSNEHRRAMANYAREDGLYDSKLVTPSFPLIAIPQRFLAGDLDNDGKDDVIYFRNGQAFWLKAKGSSDADYDFDLPQQIGNAPWQISNLNNQIIASLRFEKGSGNTHQLKATINGKLYLSTISTNSISEPVEVDNIGRALGGREWRAGQEIFSPNLRHKLTMQSDGNFVLYEGENPLWSSQTQNNEGAYASFQTDGNLVVYSASGGVLWHSSTSGHPGALLELDNDGSLFIRSSSGAKLWQMNTTIRAGGTVFRAGQEIFSPNLRYKLTMQTDGNFVLYEGGNALWSSQTQNNEGAYASFQTDGNLVVYSASGGVLWRSSTSGHPGALLELDNNGILSIKSNTGTILWPS